MKVSEVGGTGEGRARLYLAASNATHMYACSRGHQRSGPHNIRRKPLRQAEPVRKVLL